jgi:hypothetical protein
MQSGSDSSGQEDLDDSESPEMEAPEWSDPEGDVGSKSEGAELAEFLKKDHFMYDLEYPNPGVKGGFHEGYLAYLQSNQHLEKQLRAIFIISPKHYLVREQNEIVSTPVSESTAVIGHDDFEKIYNACDQAIYKAKDQTKLEDDKVRCLMDSWVKAKILNLG